MPKSPAPKSKHGHIYEYIDEKFFIHHQHADFILDWLIEYEEIMGVTYHCTCDTKALIKYKDVWNEGHRLYQEHIKERTGIQDYVKARKYYFENDFHKCDSDDCM